MLEAKQVCIPSKINSTDFLGEGIVTKTLGFVPLIDRIGNASENGEAPST